MISVPVVVRRRHSWLSATRLEFAGSAYSLLSQSMRISWHIANLSTRPHSDTDRRERGLDTRRNSGCSR